MLTTKSYDVLIGLLNDRIRKETMNLGCIRYSDTEKKRFERIIDDCKVAKQELRIEQGYSQ